MAEISLLQQILNGGTPLLLLAGLYIVGRLYLKSQDAHAAELVASRGKYDEKIDETVAQYRSFTQTISAEQTSSLEKVADALDRNTAAFDRLGSEEKAAARQEQLLDLLREAK